MGGCATKPKVLKEAQAPQPAKEEAYLESVKEDKVSTTPEPPVVVLVDVADTEKVVVKAEEGDKVQEIVDDDQDSKRRSLSVLFKENAEEKDPAGDGNPASEPPKQEEPLVDIKPREPPKQEEPPVDIKPTEPPKQEEPPVDIKPTEPPKQEEPPVDIKPTEPPKQEEPPVDIKPTSESETNPVEVEKTEVLVETLVKEVVDAQKPEIPIELPSVAGVVDDQKSEVPVQLTSVSEVVNAPETVKSEIATETVPAAETKTAETPDEKKTEEQDVADAPKETERDNAIEAAPSVETQTNGTSEEKKTEEAPEVASAPETAEAQKPTEPAAGTEAQNDGPSEEKKTEAAAAGEAKANV